MPFWSYPLICTLFNATCTLSFHIFYCPGPWNFSYPCNFELYSHLWSHSVHLAPIISILFNLGVILSACSYSLVCTQILVSWSSSHLYLNPGFLSSSDWYANLGYFQQFINCPQILAFHDLTHLHCHPDHLKQSSHLYLCSSCWLTAIHPFLLTSLLFATQPRKMWWTLMRKPVYFLLWLINLKI
jgi:hypothetical protein